MISKRILKHSFSLLNVDHVVLGEKWNYRNVISPYFRIYYIDEGYGKLSDVSTELLLEPGYLYIVPSFTFCNFHCEKRLSQYFVHFFEDSPDGISMFTNSRFIMRMEASPADIYNFSRLVAINPGRGINRSDNPQVYEKNIFYKEYQELNSQQNMSVFLETQGIILQLLSRFTVPALCQQGELRQTPAKIVDAISYISLNLNKELSVTRLANRANLNTDYFSRLFKKYSGNRPVDYIQQKRIERAQYLIVTTQLTFGHIAELTGFDNVFYFSKIFKRITGLSPRKYKIYAESVNG